MPQEELEEMAFADPRIAHIVNDQEILKTIVVPNKLVNIVISEQRKPAPTRI